MNILSFKGYELVKALPNTSEDFFNRSEVEYEIKGQKVVFSVTYLRYFEERLEEFTSLDQGKMVVPFKELFALHCVVSQPQLRSQRKLYISDEETFKKYVQTLDEEVIKSYIGN